MSDDLTPAALVEAVARAMCRNADAPADYWECDEGLRNAWMQSARAALRAIGAILTPYPNILADVAESVDSDGYGKTAALLRALAAVMEDARDE